MIAYISGRLIELSPTHAIVEAGGIGYFLHISLNSFTALGKSEAVKLFVHEVIREDTHELFGFHAEDEREVFQKLISVSGVGASTARMILSAMNPQEVRMSIETADVASIKKIKGIGAKTAERIIVDLRDKLGGINVETEKISVGGNTTRRDALLALSSLGFDKTKAERTLDQILMTEGNDISVEELLRLALKLL